MFLSLNFQWILESVHFETLDQFNHSSFEMHAFSLFNQILFSLFNIARFIIVFDITLKQKYVKPSKQLKYNHKIHTKYQINLAKNLIELTKFTYFEK